MKLHLNESDKNRLNEKVNINVTFDYLDSHFYNNGTVDEKYLLDSIGLVIDNNRELYNDIANENIEITSIVWAGFKELVNNEINKSGYECDSEHLKKWLSLRFGVKGKEIYNVFEPLYRYYEEERKERLKESTKTRHTNYENYKNNRKNKKFENTQTNKSNIYKIIDVAESLDWSCDINDDNGELLGIEFEKYSPAGEDFNFYAHGNSAREIVDSVDSYYKDFDTDEHVTMWVNARSNGVKGVPNISVLVEDADAIDEMLKELSEALYNIDFDEEDED